MAQLIPGVWHHVSVDCHWVEEKVLFIEVCNVGVTMSK